MNAIENLQQYIEEVFDGVPRWKICAASVVCTIGATWLKDILNDKSIYDKSLQQFFKYAYLVPSIKKRREEELLKTKKMLMQDIWESVDNATYITSLPPTGKVSHEIMKDIHKYLQYGKFNWEDGCASGAIYNNNFELSTLIANAYSTALWTNPLHTDLFPGVRKMEAEIIKMCCGMFHGDSESCGAITSGGTESIVMACKAYRDYAINVKGITHPEIVVPVTAHAAFDKAAALFNIKIKHVPVNPKTMRVEVKQMKKYISRRTCVIAGSAPQFPHGVIDPIEELAALGLEMNIPLHVDACLGGFLIPFMEEAGFPLKPFDFRLKGVTSISCDTHKYGFAPKGSSVVLYRNPEYRSHQFFVQPNWPGGIYATPCIAGSRPGGIVVATWAALLYHGREGYINSTKAIIEKAKYIEEEIKTIPGLEIVGEPEVSVVAFTSSKFSIYKLSDYMLENGWNLNILQFPSCIHIAVTVLHTQNVMAESFIRDLKEASELLMNDPELVFPGGSALYGIAQRIPDRSVIDEIGREYINCCYETSVSGGDVGES